MPTFYIYEDEIYTYFQEIVDLNRKTRNALESERAKVALNLNTILCAACFIEGLLEDRGNLLLGYHRETYNLIGKTADLESRKTLNFYFSRVETFFHKRLSQCTGLDNYNVLFEILTGNDFKKHPTIAPMLEGINVLFQLRNVIAHGRQIHGYEVEDDYTNEIEENFLGGYKRAEEYLIKLGLLKQKFKDVENAKIFFANEIADHFYAITQKFVEAFDEFVFENIVISDTIISRANRYNEKYGTSYDVISYLRMRGAYA